jgi:transposase
MGRHLEIEWEQSSEELKGLYKKENHPQRRTRLQALWHLRRGKRIEDVAEVTGASYRSIQDWISWYRQGGLEEVLRRVVGHHAKGVEPYLSPPQQRALVAKVKLGEFTTVWDVREWVKARWGVNYSYKGMHGLMKRLGLGLKVPRPHSEKANEAQQSEWKKGAY